jgi:hypothetical protein
MKFKIKSLDDKVSERPALVEKVNSFLYELYRDEDMFTGMQIEEEANISISFVITFNWKIDDTIFLSLIWPESQTDPITIVKTKYGELVPFTKEELKFFDLLDFEVDYNHYTGLKQDITDWVGM